MKTVSLKIPDALAASLGALARARRQTRSRIIREILQRALAQQAAVPRGSCLALARDLVGCVDGPGDLSCHKKRMRGYGS